MIGGTFALEITRPTRSPQAVPIAMEIKNARTGLVITSYFKSIPTDIPESASVDIMEISIPPTSITQSIPSAITIVTALFFSISIMDFGVRKDGLMTVTTAKSRIRIPTRSISREPVIFFKADFLSIIYSPFQFLFP